MSPVEDSECYILSAKLCYTIGGHLSCSGRLLLQLSVYYRLSSFVIAFPRRMCPSTISPASSRWMSSSTALLSEESFVTEAVESRCFSCYGGPRVFSCFYWVTSRETKDPGVF